MTDKKNVTENIVQVETTPKSEQDKVVETKAEDLTPKAEGLSGASATKNETDPIAANKTANTDKESKKSPPPMAEDKLASNFGGGGKGSNHMKSATSSSGGSAKKSKSAMGPILVSAVVIAVAGATIWYMQQQNQRYSSGLEQQLQANIRASNQANEQVKEAMSLLHAQQQKLNILEQRLASTQEQAADLNQALQTLTDAGTEVILLNDIDHLVTIAQQQLSLGGNVANAIVSLETAQARLARANRPTLASLQQTINGDLDRLRAASTADVSSLSRQLEQLSEQLNNAPLLMPDETQLTNVTVENESSTQVAPVTETSKALADDAAWWERSFNTVKQAVGDGFNAVRHDLGEFISIRRVDDASALLMSPEQANRFRDNLRIRVSSAKLALMTNQPSVWKAETTAIVKAIEQRFDPRSSASVIALQSATALSQVNIVSELPTVDNSLSAIEALLQEQSTKASEQTESGSPKTVESLPDESNNQTIEDPEPQLNMESEDIDGDISTEATEGESTHAVLSLTSIDTERRNEVVYLQG